MKRVIVVCCVMMMMASITLFADDPKNNAKGKDVSHQKDVPTNVSFSAQASQEFMKRVAETSRKIEEIKAQIEARKAEIFNSNEEVKKLFEKQKELQQKINSILEQDKELSDLKIKRDILSSVMPQMMRRRSAPPVLP